MNAAEFNALCPVGTPVVAYPGARPEDIPSARRLVTRTRSEAQPFGLDREGVVWVDGHGACIALTHIDVVTDTEPITDLATAVEVMGALPMPAGPASPQKLSAEREQEIRALEPAPPGLVGLGRAGSESERALYGRAVELHQACGQLLTELGRMRAELDVVAKFVAKRAEYITAIENCHPNNDYDYNRWQGHAESRRQLAQQLGLPVAWPVKGEEAGR